MGCHFLLQCMKVKIKREVASVVSDSVRPHRRRPTRLPCPWDSPGKNTGVGHHFLLQCMKVKREREVTRSCRTLCDPMDCSLSGSSIHGIFQARVLEWGAIAFSRKHPNVVIDLVFNSVTCYILSEKAMAPTPVFLPGESQGRGSLVGCRLWGRRVGHD